MMFPFKRSSPWLTAATLCASLTSPPASAAGVSLPVIQVSADGHHLQQADGKPFFWLADTAWSIAMRLTREETDLYLRDRAAKGFNIIQLVAACGPLDFLDGPNRYGALPFIAGDPYKPNQAYFAHIDYIVERATHYGLHVAMVPMWSIAVVPKPFDAKAAETYGRWLGARYRGKAILWMLGGDANPVSRDFVGDPTGDSVIDNRKIYDALARGITAGEAADPFLTYHLSGLSSPGTSEPRTSLFLANRPWLDMNIVQSSHFRDATATKIKDGLNFAWDGTRAYEPITLEYRSSPARPVVDAEAMFEDNPVDLDPDAAKGYWTGDDTRGAAYQAVFAGAAGHTFGHNSIWQFYGVPGVRFERKQMTITWQEALQRPSSVQMGFLRRLMLSRPFLETIPDQGLVAGSPGEAESHIGALRDRGGTFIMVYSGQGKPIDLDLTKLNAPKARAWWFDPRSGIANALPTLFATDGVRRFTPATSGLGHDWVLVVDDARKGFGPPGSAAAQR